MTSVVDVMAFYIFLRLSVLVDPDDTAPYFRLECAFYQIQHDQFWIVWKNRKQQILQGMLLKAHIFCSTVYDIINQSINQILCETCYLSEHCNNANCLRNPEELQILREQMHALIK